MDTLILGFLRIATRKDDMAAFDYGSYLGLRDKATLKSAILAGVQELGGTYAEASYSGGNDEGGVDGVSIYRLAEEGQTENIAHLHLGVDYDDYITCVDVSPAREGFGWDDPLWDAFQDLLNHDFGTWAGDFSASGSVFVDVDKKRIWRTGEISTYTDDDTAGEY